MDAPNGQSSAKRRKTELMIQFLVLVVVFFVYVCASGPDEWRTTHEKKQGQEKLRPFESDRAAATSGPNKGSRKHLHISNCTCWPQQLSTPSWDVQIFVLGQNTDKISTKMEVRSYLSESQLFAMRAMPHGSRFASFLPISMAASGALPATCTSETQQT